MVSTKVNQNTNRTRLLVGLGNPGSEYIGHRHNFGVMCVDKIVSTSNYDRWKVACGCLFTNLIVSFDNTITKVIVAKPQQFMNCCGKSIAEFARYYHISTEEMIIIHDDIDLSLGKIRHKCGGGSGGHNGIRDIQHHLLANNFHRLRLGIGYPANQLQLNSYVLSNFSNQEQPIAMGVINEITRHKKLLINQQFIDLMNKIALKNLSSIFNE